MTINCAERGLLLLRVRDEIRMTIAAYQTLYESSVAFGMRKALQAEQGKADMERKASFSSNKALVDCYLVILVVYKICHIMRFLSSQLCLASMCNMKSVCHNSCNVAIFRELSDVDRNS